MRAFYERDNPKWREHPCAIAVSEYHQFAPASDDEVGCIVDSCTSMAVFDEGGRLLGPCRAVPVNACVVARVLRNPE